MSEKAVSDDQEAATLRQPRWPLVSLGHTPLGERRKGVSVNLIINRK